MFGSEKKLSGKKVAILATHGFEQSELLEPKKALEDAGAEVKVVSIERGKIKSWKDNDWGDSIDVDLTLDSTRADDYDALLLPGGVINPDTLRNDESAVAFVRNFFEARKPIAAICHGPWTLIDAGAVRGRTVTSWPSIRTDLMNAGANWVDEEAVVDNGLVTSRKPQDIPAFNRKMIEEFAEGRHARPPSAGTTSTAATEGFTSVH